MTDFDVTHQTLHWIEGDVPHCARWRSESGMAPPKRVVIADDRMNADSAFRLASEGTGLLWRGDFQNARLLLQAIARRIDQGVTKKKKKNTVATLPVLAAERFHLHRQAQSQRARTLGMLLLPFDAGFTLPLRRAPNVQLACRQAYGDAEKDQPFVGSLRELLGVIGAYEWRKKGVEIPALGASIHPYYGVFSPVRGEYVALVASAPFSAKEIPLAFDIGTGTGVLAAVLARRGVAKIIATEQDPRALACAQDNLQRLGLEGSVEIVLAHLFPVGRAPLVVCNPPWIPARPTSPIEHAIYDPESRMLRGFLAGLAEHLTPDGEGWLILSDLAEHLGLRSRDELMAWIDAAGLSVSGQIDVLPTHPRVADTSDGLHAARAAEVTTLWRLKAKTT